MRSQQPATLSVGTYRVHLGRKVYTAEIIEDPECNEKFVRFSGIDQPPMRLDEVDPAAQFVRQDKE